MRWHPVVELLPDHFDGAPSLDELLAEVSGHPTPACSRPPTSLEVDAPSLAAVNGSEAAADADVPSPQQATAELRGIDDSYRDMREALGRTSKLGKDAIAFPVDDGDDGDDDLRDVTTDQGASDDDSSDAAESPELLEPRGPPEAQESPDREKVVRNLDENVGAAEQAQDAQPDPDALPTGSRGGYPDMVEPAN